jgi:hypothetical protein
MTESMKNALEWGFKILSVIVIPLILYIITLAMDMQLLDHSVSNQKRVIEKMESVIEKIEGDLNQVQLNSQELRQMRVDLNEQNAMMREVYQWVLRQQGRTSRATGGD